MTPKLGKCCPKTWTPSTAQRGSTSICGFPTTTSSTSEPPSPRQASPPTPSKGTRYSLSHLGVLRTAQRAQKHNKIAWKIAVAALSAQKAPFPLEWKQKYLKSSNCPLDLFAFSAERLHYNVGYLITMLTSIFFVCRGLVGNFSSGRALVLLLIIGD